MNRKLKGWAAQYRFCDAYNAYREIDAAVNAALLESVVRQHPKMPVKKLIKRYWFDEGNGRQWYCLPDEKHTRVIHLIDTMLVSPTKLRENANPHLFWEFHKARREAETIERVNAKYRPVWERREGKCLYCGLPILPGQDRKLAVID
ncbi:MAG: hypothetical protein IJ584_12865 [Bacteroidales bacterium]|nr:hypothetical protein [Bacteroidales bacterium]